MPLTSAQPEGEAKMSGIFSPSWDKIIPFYHCFFSSPTLPKSQIWDKFQGTFSQGDA